MHNTIDFSLYNQVKQEWVDNFRLFNYSTAQIVKTNSFIGFNYKAKFLPL